MGMDNFALLVDGSIVEVVNETLEYIDGKPLTGDRTTKKIAASNVHRISTHTSILEQVRDSTEFRKSGNPFKNSAFRLSVNFDTGTPAHNVNHTQLFSEADVRMGKFAHIEVPHQLIASVNAMASNIRTSDTVDQMLFYTYQDLTMDDQVYCGEMWFEFVLEEGMATLDKIEFLTNGMVTVKNRKVSVFILGDSDHPHHLCLPSQLHTTTGELIIETAEHLGVKLTQSQYKMGLVDGWRSLPPGTKEIPGKTFNDVQSMNDSLIAHLQKGDILDSIAYLMFMHKLGYAIQGNRFQGA